jgi:hypothetical protein
MLNFPTWSDLGLDVLSPATRNTWDAEQGRASQYWYYYSGFIFKEKIEDIDPQIEDAPLMYPVGVNLTRMLTQAHADAAYGDYQTLPFTFQPREDDDIEDLDREAARLMRTVLLDSDITTFAWELELERQVFGGGAFKVSPDLLSSSGIRWQRIPKGNFYPIWDPSDPNQLLEVYIITWLTSDQAKAKYNYDAGTNTSPADFIPRVEHWTRSRYEVRFDGEIIPAESGANVWGVVPFVYIPRIRFDSWWGESLTEGVMAPQNEINMRLGDIGEAINYNSHPILWGLNINKNFDTDTYPIGPRAMWDLGRSIGSSPPPQVGVLEVKNPIPEGTFRYIEFLYDWARTSTFAPPIAFGEDNGGGQRSGSTLEIRLWPLMKSIQRSRSYLFVGLRQAQFITAKILKQKKYSHIDDKVVNRLLAGNLEPSFANILPRDHAADVDEVVKLFSTKVPSISLETAQKILGRGPGEVSRIIKMLGDQKFQQFFEEQDGPDTSKTPIGNKD